MSGTVGVNTEADIGLRLAAVATAARSAAWRGKGRPAMTSTVDRFATRAFYRVKGSVEH
jgi:hypothetical protein